MIGNFSVIAIIPARGGSKGLPGKNIRLLLGKPLIGWSIEQALASKYIDEVVVSSDCSEIINISRKFGANVPFKRPAKLATDEATTIDVLAHTHEFYKNSLKQKFEYSVLIEPTAPLRNEDDIDLMIQKLDNLKNDFDAVVSIGEVSEHPSIMKICNGNALEAYLPGGYQGTRRQDYKKVYWPYGGLFVNKTDAMIKENSLYPQRLTFHVLDKSQCCEIDDYFDFVKTEAIMKKIWKK